MPAISTDQLLIVDIREIDEQHLAIVSMINRFHDALLSPDPERLDAERALVWGTLTETFANHFSSEQEFMSRIGYPGLGDHTMKHRAFLDLIERTKQKAEEGFVPLNSELIKTLSRWFLEHETVEDRGYADFHHDRFR
jgi:hemerythrin-like metal-binding protein